MWGGEAVRENATGTVTSYSKKGRKRPFLGLDQPTFWGGDHSTTKF